MQEFAIDKSQRFYARLAGFMYLANYAAAVFGALMPARIRGSGDFATTARRVLESETFYRATLTSMSISWILIVVLGFALYVTLEPVNKRLAQLALFMELGQASVGSFIAILSFATLQLRLIGAQPSAALDAAQLETLVLGHLECVGHWVPDCDDVLRSWIDDFLLPVLQVRVSATTMGSIRCCDIPAVPHRHHCHSNLSGLSDAAAIHLGSDGNR